ncbi:PAS domain S-box protein [Desulfopila sp. IMCC35006]|uniref:sigma 54-interacting transcriptional regulator n=1 Tax=Desulfopila sp. IMCC35006 TaxID=2569542 RepID=UPI0010AC0805|nr:sigma 54-interacting transcriptional regulator [Desulfopila sp. IMCC35006]TKB26244.1 PAS domain S-box protein [Desulfopila sp. IMCC35006]
MAENDNQTVLENFVSALKFEVEYLHLEISQFRQIFASISDGVICIDGEQRIIMVNPAMENLFGYMEEEFLGQKAEFLYSCSKDYQQLEQAAFKWNTGEKSGAVEARFRRKDGGIFTAETNDSIFTHDNGRLICYIRFFRDMTRQKELENCLLREQCKFRILADFAYNLESWTRPDGSFLYISPSCHRITGYHANEFMENPSLLKDIIFPEDKEKFAEHLHDGEEKIDLRELQFRIVRRDGKVRWIAHTCQAVTGDEGEFLGYRSSNQDITRQKEYENRLRHTLSEVASCKVQLEAESAYLQEEIKLSFNYDNIIGSSNALQYVLFKIEQIAATDTTVLLLGETGTGKELFARAIHNTSLRKGRPMIKINCAALPANLIESELFGHEKGAFTSAYTRQLGRFELADKATIFLDEIGELPLELQAKLLRVLQEGEFVRLGSARTTKVDVRIIAATNRDLEDDVNKGLFRRDLWYRLNVFPITAPPLRDRIDDIPQLTTFFFERFTKKLKKPIGTIPFNVMQQLKNYSWPGNVRELENVIERAVISSTGSKLSLADKLEQSLEKSTTDFLTLEEMERSYILKVLEEADWKVSGKNSASEILGLQRSTLRAKMVKHNLRKP